jgi:hypothetical protein
VKRLRDGRVFEPGEGFYPRERSLPGIGGLVNWRARRHYYTHDSRGRAEARRRAEVQRQLAAEAEQRRRLDAIRDTYFPLPYSRGRR